MASANERRTAKGVKGPADATSFDWLLLIVISVFGGLAFSMIREAVASVPPPHVTVGRLWVGAIILYVIMRAKGRRFPRFLVKTPKGPRLHRSWVSMMLMGLIGNALPFLIFPYAQQYVESGLAGIFMAFMPLWTLLLAFLFANEKVGPQKLVGFALGFLGVVILMAPELQHGLQNSSLVAQLLLLLATFLYAASAVIARRAPPIRPRVFSAGFILSAAVISTPFLLLADLNPSEWRATSLASIFGLGLLPTGLNAILIIMLIRRAGAGFMSLANYITPVVAVALGALIFGERLQPNAYLALVVILFGVAASQRKARKPALGPPVTVAEKPQT